MIEFSIYNVTFQAEEGMTWGEWANSEYNTIPGVMVSGSYILNISGSGPMYVADGTTKVLITDTIVANKTYTWSYEGGAA